AREKLDGIMQKEEPELDDNIVITNEARNNATTALKLLDVRQIGSFLANLELTDPAELITSAFDSVRGLKDKEREEEAGTVAEEVAWLVDGADGDESEKTKDQVTALLQRAAAIKSDGDFQKQRKSLQDAAKQIIGDVDSLQVLDHIAEKGMAELLSN